MRAAHVPPDQEPGQTHHPVLVIKARRRVPAEPALPRRLLRRRGYHPDGAEPAVFGPQQVPHLPADQWPGSLRMPVLHQPLPDLPVRRIRNHNQRETLNLTDLRRNVPGRRDRRRPVPPDTGSTGRSPGWKPDLIGPLQDPKGRQTGGDLGLSQAIQEAEISTQTFGKCRAMRNLACSQDLGDMKRRLWPGELVPDLVLNFHGRHRSSAEIKCSASLVGHG